MSGRNHATSVRPWPQLALTAREHTPKYYLPAQRVLSPVVDAEAGSKLGVVVSSGSAVFAVVSARRRRRGARYESCNDQASPGVKRKVKARNARRDEETGYRIFVRCGDPHRGDLPPSVGVSMICSPQTRHTGSPRAIRAHRKHRCLKHSPQLIATCT
jgi:hypothetical protein